MYLMILAVRAATFMLSGPSIYLNNDPKPQSCDVKLIITTHYFMHCWSC